MDTYRRYQLGWCDERQKIRIFDEKADRRKYIWESRLPLAITSVDINTGRTVFVSSKEKRETIMMFFI